MKSTTTQTSDSVPGVVQEPEPQPTNDDVISQLIAGGVSKLTPEEERTLLRPVMIGAAKEWLETLPLEPEYGAWGGFLLAEDEHDQAAAWFYDQMELFARFLDEDYEFKGTEPE